MTPSTALYKCADGTDFPVVWENPNHAELQLEWNDHHWPKSVKPFDAASWVLTEAACHRAHDDAGIPLATRSNAFLAPHGFIYSDRTRPSREKQTSEFSEVRQFTDRMGGILEAWQGFCLPKVEEACNKVLNSDAGVSTVELVDVFGYALQMTMVSVQTLDVPMLPLMSFLETEVGSEAETYLAELTAGAANDTLNAGQMLWEVAQIARASNSLINLIVTTEPDQLNEAITEDYQGSEFLEAFDDYLERYGGRSTQWEPSAPTVREQPELLLTSIKHIIINDVPEPLEVQRNVQKRAEKLVVEIENQIGTNEEKLTQFRDLLAAAKPFVTVRENRAFWQLVACGSLRAAVLHRAERLTDAGVISQIEDIFFLEPEEIDRYLAHSNDTAKNLIEQRRKDWEFWSTKTPPHFIGKDAEESQQISDSEGVPDNILRGVGASRGVVTGRARVIMDLSEAVNFQPGDILVCMMTAPPWTILFTKAAAVVTDTGGVLSHASIASREFGLPCVAAVRNATSIIRDGMLITVDGAEGTVTIED
jgi:phosphohistidine swiveling domain-containing protein